MGITTSPHAVLRSASGFAAVIQTGFATISILMINVVTGILSARLLGPQGRGELSALLLCPQFLPFLFTLGLPVSLVVLARKRPAYTSTLVGAALLVAAAAGVASVAGGLLLIPRLTQQYSVQTAHQARLLLVFVFGNVIQSVLFAGLQLRERFAAFNWLRCLQSALVLASLAVLALTAELRPITAALAYLVPSLPLVVWNAIWIARELRPNLEAFAARSTELLSLGLRAHLVETGSTLFNQLDKVILVGLVSPPAFGIYVVVFNLSRLLLTAGTSVIPVLLPKVSGRSGPEIVEVTSKALAATALLNAAGVIPFVLLGKLGLAVVYGSSFAAGYLTLVILTIESALTGVTLVLQQPYLMMRRPGAVATCHLVSLAVGGVLMRLLAGRFGAEGAACGLLIATFLRFTLTYLVFGWLLGMKPPRIIPNRSDWEGLFMRVRLR